MRGGDVVHEIRVIHKTEALIVHNDVVTFPPLLVLVDGNPVRAVSPFMDDRELDVRPLAHALRNDVLLLRVIMAAAAADHQRL